MCVCFHVVSHCQCGAGGREDLSLDQDEEVQCESVRVHVTLDTVDNSQPGIVSNFHWLWSSCPHCRLD